jgi:hypothetical protein
MLVFVDESGDQGLLGRFGSSSLFVISAVMFVDGADAFACSAAISQLQCNLLGTTDVEFKFNKSSRTMRCEFFKVVSEFDFLHVSIAINKQAFVSSELQMDAPFYRYACKLLLDVARPYLNNATVIIDGNGRRRFTREIQNYLRTKMNSEAKVIKRVSMESSHSNNLLQLADMVCGAVARSFRADKEDRFLYRRLLFRKELEVVVWPKK